MKYRIRNWKLGVKETRELARWLDLGVLVGIIHGEVKCWQKGKFTIPTCRAERCSYNTESQKLLCDSLLTFSVRVCESGLTNN